MSDTIQIRGNTAAYWQTHNIVPAAREMVFETDTKRFKLGDGITAWNSLPYIGDTSTVSGSVRFSSIPIPSTPDAGLEVFSKLEANRRMLTMLGTSGLYTNLQPALFGNRVYMLMPSSSTTMTFFGGSTHTAVGTVSTPALASTNFLDSISHTQILSATVAGSPAHQRVAQTMAWRGDTPGHGGWFYRLRFGLKLLSATHRGFCGLHSSTTTIAGTVVPSSLVNVVGVIWDDASSNIQFMTSRTSGTRTLIDTGIPTVQGYVYELTTFTPPNSNIIYQQLEVLNPGINLSSNATFTDTNTMPLSTTFLAHHAWLTNDTSTTAVNLSFNRLYIETDY